MVQTIKFSEMIPGGDLAPDDETPGLLSGANVLFNNPWTFLAPGTTGDRPVPTPDIYFRLRFNTTLEIYEYYDPTIPLWVELSGSGTGTVNPGVSNDIAFYAASGQAVSPIASNANAVLVSNSSSVPSMSTTLPTGLSIPGATITSSTAALLSGSVVAAPVAGTDLTNKTYVDGLFASGVTSITGTTNQVIVNHPTGAVTLSLPQDIALGSTPTFAGLTLSSIPLSVSSGGSGRNSATAYTLIAGGTTSTSAFQSLLAGSSGQLLQSNGAGALPTWTTSTFPIGPGTLNHLLRSDGTNWVETTLTTIDASDVMSGLTQLNVTNTSAGSTTNVVNLINNTASGINSGVSLNFQPNAQSARQASIRSLQTTAGTYADLEFYTAGGATPVLAMSINTDQQVIIGSTTNNAGSNFLEVNGVNTNGSTLISSFINTPASAPSLRFLKSRNTTVGSHTTVQNADTVGVFSFFGDDGTNYTEGARITSTVRAAVSTGIVPCNLAFFTADTSGSLNQAMAISTSQIVTLNNPLPVGSGGLGVATTPTNGQVPIGNGTTYTAANLTAGAGISITNGSGSITISSSTSGMTWTTVTTSQSAVIDNGYVANSAGALTFTLPATAAVGDVIAIEGLGAGGWIVTANTGQTIKIGASSTSSAGSLTSNVSSDNVYVTCIVANTTWRVRSTNSAGLTIS